MADSAPPSYNVATVPPRSGADNQTSISNAPSPVLDALNATSNFTTEHSARPLNNSSSNDNNTINNAHPNLPPGYYAPAASSSRPASIASTMLPDYSRRQPGPAWARSGRYSSEEEYLDALRAWVRDKEYTQPSRTAVPGFYGSKTADEYIDKEALRRRAEKKEKKREEKEAKRRTRAASSASASSVSAAAAAAGMPGRPPSRVDSNISADSHSSDSQSIQSSRRKSSSFSMWLKSHVRKNSIAE